MAAGRALGAERLQALCSGECYNPGGARRAIERLEIVRIRTQRNAADALAPLIEDPWRVAACDDGGEVCEMVIEDDAFVEDAVDTVYYARAVEAPSDAVNGAHAPCPPEREPDCLAPVEERAWSSPIFVDFAAPLSVPRAVLH